MSQLKPDELPWVDVARKVMVGTYDKADDTTRESLKIGLRSTDHPTCKAAMRRLFPDKEK